MKKKNGFTLIELLAVIIILGILMIIAIPSVTKYISDSRKSDYVDTAKEIISGARNMVNDGKLEMYDTGTTYYIDAACIKTENGEAKSPYGEFTKAYVVVIYDDIDIEPGFIKVRKSGSPGSHNGMKSVTHCLNSQNFARVRIGTGKPENGEDLIEYVIGAIDEGDISKLENGIKQATEAVSMIIEENIDNAMNKYNIRKIEKNDENL